MPNPGEVARFTKIVPDIKDKGERLRFTQKKTTGGTPNEVGIQSGVVGVAALPTIIEEQSQQEKARQVQQATKGLIAVSESYAQQNHLGTVKIGDYYYRPAISSSENKRINRLGITREEYMLQKLASMGYKKAPETMLTGGTPGEVARRTQTTPMPAGTAREQAIGVEKRKQELKLAPVLEAREAEWRKWATAEQIARMNFDERLKWEAELKAANPALFNIYKTGGVSVYNQAIHLSDKSYTMTLKAQEAALKLLEPYKKQGWYEGSPDTYDIISYIKANNKNDKQLNEARKVLHNAGFDAESIKTAEKYVMAGGQLWYYNGKTITEKERDELIAKYKRQSILVQEGKLDPSKLGDNPSDFITKVASPEARATIQGFIPIVSTINYSKEASKEGWTGSEVAWMTAQVAFDALFFLPVITGAAAGARAATSGSMWVSRGARIKGALKGAGEYLLATVAAPYTIVAHPLETVKGLYKPIETVLFPRRIPVGAVETTYHTIKLPQKMVGAGVKETKALRTAVTKAAIGGEEAIATVEGVTFKLEPTALQKLGAPVAISGTPDVRPFLEGAVVSKDGLFVAPSLHTRFAQATSGGAVPKGAVKGALFIRDEKILQSLQASPRTGLYKGTAEIEEIVKAGTNLGKPTQILYTRDANGDLLHILVFGKKFSPFEVAKLKLIGMADTIRVMYTPPAELKGEASAIKAMKSKLLQLEDDAARLSKAGDTTELSRVRAQIEEYRALIQTRQYVASVRPAYATFQGYDPLENARPLLGSRRNIAPRAIIAQSRDEIRRTLSKEAQRLPIEVRRIELTGRHPIITRSDIPEGRQAVPGRPSIPPREPIQPRTPTTPRETIAPRESIPPRETIPPRVPVPPREPVPPPRVPPRLAGGDKGKAVQKGYEGAVAWAQGQLRRAGGKNVTGYRIWKYPYRQEDLEWRPETDLPIGIQVVAGVSEAQKTVQQFRGKVAPRETQEADIGAFVARVERPAAKPGSGQIRFTRDTNPESWNKLVMHTTLDQLIQIVFKPSPATTTPNIMKAMGMSAKVAEKANLTAKQRFAKSRLAEKLEDTSHGQIVSAIEKNNLSSSEKKELLKMLPDRSRNQVEVIMSNPILYAPTRGTPKAEYSLLRRKKIKTKKSGSMTQSLIQVRR